MVMSVHSGPRPGPRRKRLPATTPIMAGIAAIALATLFLGAFGLVAASLAVGSWWAYKFWPRPPAPDPPEARAFLRSMEDPSLDRGTDRHPILVADAR